VVNDRKMSKSYRCGFTYTVELAEHCNRISNKVIFQALDGRGFFNRNVGPSSKEEALDARLFYLQCIWRGENPTPAMLENIQKVTTKLRIEELKTILDAS